MAAYYEMDLRDTAVVARIGGIEGDSVRLAGQALDIDLVEMVRAGHRSRRKSLEEVEVHMLVELPMPAERTHDLAYHTWWPVEPAGCACFLSSRLSHEVHQ